MIRLEYRNIEGFQEEEPLTVDLTSSPGNVYLRKNIVSVPNVDQDGNETEGTHWRYDEVLLSAEEYQEYLSNIDNPMLSTIMQTLSEIQLQIDELS